MSRPSPRRRHLVAGLLATSALVAACGGQSTPSTAATPAASAGASTPAASGAITGNGLLDVRIGAPYTLADLPASQADAIQTGIEKNLGAYGKAVHVNVKEIQQSGTPAAYLMVVAFPQGTLSDNVYSQVITNLSMGAEADYTPKLISNVPVTFGTMNGGSVAVFREGDLLLITLAVKATDLTPIATALVSANG